MQGAKVSSEVEQVRENGVQKDIYTHKGLRMLLRVSKVESHGCTESYLTASYSIKRIA
jgi:hypothetical protein